MKNHLFRPVVVCILMVLCCSPLFPQSFLFHSLPKDKPQLELRYMRTTNERFNELSTFSGIYDISLNVPISSKFNLVGSIPIVASYSTSSYYSGTHGASVVGNIYLGIQTPSASTASKQSILSVGLFLPTAPTSYFSDNLGTSTNANDIHKYIQNTLTLHGNYTLYSLSIKNALFGFEIGPDIWFPAGDELFGNGDRDVEFLAHYGIVCGLKQGNLTILTEVVGSAIISEDVEDFGERFFHAISFGIHYAALPVKPGLFYKMYLEEDWREYHGSVIGLKLETAL